MAPMKSMKRSSADTAASDTKRRCLAVAKAVAGSGELSDSCKAMLSGISAFALDSFQGERHPWQVSVVDMVKTTLSGVEDAMTKRIAATAAKVGMADRERLSRFDAVATAETELQDKVDVVGAKKAAADESAAAFKNAREVLSDATSKQTTGNEEYNRTADKKARMDFFKRNAFVPLKEGALKGKETNSALKIVASVSKQFDLEKPMVRSVLEALKRAPTDRTSFLVTSIAQMEQEFDALMAGFVAQLEQGEPAKQARAEAVAAAETKVAEAKDASSACANALHEAQNEKTQAASAVKAAQHSRTHFLPDMKKLMDGYDHEKTSLQQFRSSAMTDFQELETLEPPPPSPVEEEHADEDVANEAGAPHEETADVAASGAYAAGGATE